LLLAVVGAALALVILRRPAPEGAVTPLPDFPFETMEPVVEAQFVAARRRAEAAPHDADAVGEFGMLFHAYGFHAMAETCYERAHTLDPVSLRWLGYLARARLAVGSFDEASAAFAQLLAGDPDDVAGLVLKAEADRQAHRLDDALAGYERAIGIDTHVPQAHCGAGRVLLELGRLDEAITHLTVATLQAESYGTARYALGEALREKGDREAAMTQFALARKHSEVEPELNDPLMVEVALLRRGAIDALHEGIDLLRDGHLSDALPKLEEAVRLAPDLAEAQSQLGAALLLAGADDRAESHLRRALEIDPDFVDARYNLGLLAHRRGEAATAAAHFAHAVSVRGDHFDAHLGLGAVLPALGRRDEAITHLERALALRPADARPYKRLAALLAAAGRHHEALGVLRRGHLELPDDASVTDRLAWHLATCPDPSLRDAGEALTLTRTVVRRTGGDIPQALSTLAAALAGTGAFEDALAALERAETLVARQGSDEALARRLAGQRAEYLQGSLFLEPSGR
jgi:tetratricopeptide (TPR) repeat protein